MAKEPKVLRAFAEAESITFVLKAKCPHCAEEIVHTEEVQIEHQTVDNAYIRVETSCQECEAPAILESNTKWGIAPIRHVNFHN